MGSLSPQPAPHFPLASSHAGATGMWAPALSLAPAPRPPCSALSQTAGTCWWRRSSAGSSPQRALPLSPAAAGRRAAPPGAPADFDAAFKEKSNGSEASSTKNNQEKRILNPIMLLDPFTEKYRARDMLITFGRYFQQNPDLGNSIGQTVQFLQQINFKGKKR